MTTYDENQLAALFAAEAPTPLPGDWEDVLRRASGARRRLRRLPPWFEHTGRPRFVVVMVAMVVAVIVGAAAALGIRALLADRGFIGLPPPGAVASAPERGKVVLRASGRCTPRGHFCYVWAFSDGRLIWGRDGRLPPYGANDSTTGLLEQRLTATGIRLLLAAFASTEQCASRPLARRALDCIPSLPGPAPFPAVAHPGWKDVSWGLPPNAWKDVVVRAFVPARFAFCFVASYRLVPGYWRSRTIDPRRMSALLPVKAGTLLKGKEVVPNISAFGDESTCFALTTADARRLANVLDRGRVKRLKPTYVLLYHIDLAPGLRAEMWFAPMLPNGEWLRSGGG